MGCKFLCSFGYLPRSGTAGSYGGSVFRFLRKLHAVPTVTGSILLCFLSHLMMATMGLYSKSTCYDIKKPREADPRKHDPSCRRTYQKHHKQLPFLYGGNCPLIHPPVCALPTPSLGPLTARPPPEGLVDWGRSLRPAGQSGGKRRRRLLLKSFLYETTCQCDLI